jgi:hypothetical protein
MTRRFTAGAHLRVLAAAAFALAFAQGARAQTAQTAPPDAVPGDAAPAAGWTLTPSLVFSTGYDNNVLLHEQNDTPPSDLLNVLNPRGALDYRGPRSEFSGSYDGALLLYRDFSSLDSFDQHGSVRASRKLSPHLSLFAANSVGVSPTTESLLLAGVPFVRTGSKFDDLTAGVNVALTKRTSLIAGGRLQWVQFDAAHPLDIVLQGGHSQGATMTLRHDLTSRLALTADYDVSRANVANGQGEFDVQNGSVGFDRTLSPTVHVFAAGGVSYLNVTAFAPARSGITYRAGATARLRRAGLDVAYSRSFVPSFGFGGTSQNEGLTAQMRIPLSRRVYAQSSLSWRRNEALTPGEPSLHSRWLEGSVDYALAPWAHVEGFFGTLSQSIDRPGGLAGRTQVGVEIITTAPMRIR